MVVYEDNNIGQVYFKDINSFFWKGINTVNLVNIFIMLFSKTRFNM